MQTSILVAADLHPVREWLAHDLASAPDLPVVSTVADRMTALSLARSLSPDALVLDRSMPDSLRAVREIVAERPCIRVLAYGVQETRARGRCLLGCRRPRLHPPRRRPRGPDRQPPANRA